MTPLRHTLEAALILAVFLGVVALAGRALWLVHQWAQRLAP
jgi:type IV secretory pathway TrbD component